MERPPTFVEPFEAYLSADQKPTVTLWLKAPLDAINSSQAVIQSAFDAAVETNLRRLRGRVRNSKGAIDTDIIQAALGRMSTRQLIWGILGQVSLGIVLWCLPAQMVGIIEQLRGSESTEAAQRVVGIAEEIRIRMQGPPPSGPRRLGDLFSGQLDLAA